MIPMVIRVPYHFVGLLPVSLKGNRFRPGGAVAGSGPGPAAAAVRTEYRHPGAPGPGPGTAGEKW